MLYVAAAATAVAAATVSVAAAAAAVAVAAAAAAVAVAAAAATAAATAAVAAASITGEPPDRLFGCKGFFFFFVETTGPSLSLTRSTYLQCDRSTIQYYLLYFIYNIFIIYYL